MPGGAPRWVRIYDNRDRPDGGTIDRYTVVFTGRYRHLFGGSFQLLGMSIAPYHPQGFCQHSEYNYQVDTIWHYKDGRPPKYGVLPPAIGRKCHLGKRIAFAELPSDCQMAVLQDYFCIWDLLDEPHAVGLVLPKEIAPIMLEEFGIRYDIWLPEEKK